MDAFAASKATEHLIIAVPAGQEERASAIAAQAGIPAASIVAGGATRAESVAAALELANCDVVAIHDAARPLLTPELIDSLAALLAADPGADAVIAAAPIADTIKRAGEGGAVAETIDRCGLWGAQTPQLFRTARLHEAIASHGGVDATDEAMLVEAAGGMVLMQAPRAHNFKVTTQADLSLADALLRGPG